MEDLARALKKDGKETPVSDVMDRSFKTLEADKPLADGYRSIQQGAKTFSLLRKMA